jgi:hypothetical protein
MVKYIRKSDGFVFVILKGRASHGASMRCVDAARIFGWFSAATIARDFVAVLP